MCHCRLNYNKCTTVVREVDSGVGCVYVVVGVPGNSVLSIPLCCKPKTSLKRKAYVFKNLTTKKSTTMMYQPNLVKF